jgi:hypothetical protein
MYVLVPPTSIDTLTDDPFPRDAFLSNQMATVKNVSSVFSYAYVLVSSVADFSLTVKFCQLECTRYGRVQPEPLGRGSAYLRSLFLDGWYDSFRPFPRVLTQSLGTK